MSNPSAVPAILQPRQRVRYLKLIALFKIGKGVLLLTLGVSLLFLHSRDRWMDAMSDWVENELLLVHSKLIVHLLNRLQDILQGEALRATGLLALFYSGILFTEGIGVYLQKRWAELLMVFATAALIPVEIRHLLRRPSVAALVILLINCFIVWFLYRVLRREPQHPRVEIAPEIAKIS